MGSGVYTRTKPPWNKGLTGVYSAEALAAMSESSKGQIPPNKGRSGHLTSEQISNISESHLGQIPWNKGVPVPDEVREKIRRKCRLYVPTEEAKQKQSKAQLGWYRAGNCPISVKTVISGAVIGKWRIAVFTRDDYTCQWCGQRGGYLEADHIIPKWGDVGLVYTVSNGRTLCKLCHTQTSTYKSKAPRRPTFFQIPLPMVVA